MHFLVKQTMAITVLVRAADSTVSRRPTTSESQKSIQIDYASGYDDHIPLIVSGKGRDQPD